MLQSCSLVEDSGGPKEKHITWAITRLSGTLRYHPKPSFAFVICSCCCLDDILHLLAILEHGHKMNKELWLFGNHLLAVRQQSLVNFVLLNGRLFLSFLDFTAVYSMPVRPAFIHNDELFSTWWPSLLKLLQSGARLALMTWKGLGAAVIQWPSSSQAAAQWPWERDIKGAKTSLLTLSSSSIVPHSHSRALHPAVSLVPSPPSLLSWCFDPSKQVETL